MASFAITLSIEQPMTRFQGCSIFSVRLIDWAWFNVCNNTIQVIWPTAFYRSKDPTNSIKVLKEKATKENNQKTQKTQNTHIHTHTK